MNITGRGIGVDHTVIDACMDIMTIGRGSSKHGATTETPQSGTSWASQWSDISSVTVWQYAWRQYKNDLYEGTVKF